MPPPLTTDEYRLFSEWLAAEFGLRFGPEKREILRARLEPRRAELNVPSFERLLFHVRFHPDRERERKLLISALTNNESYFFRESRQLDVLRELLPELARRNRRAGEPRVRLASAGSASGEEAYTLSIVATEALAGLGVQPIVTGVDVDIAALERAEAGIYRPHAFRGVPEDVRDRYFDPLDAGWRLKPRIRSAARFQHGNLVDPDWTRTVSMQDVVFCRNVMIYFDEAGVKRAVENLFRVLRPGGYLFLGHAESLSRIPTRFHTERRPGVLFYRRPEE